MKDIEYKGYLPINKGKRKLEEVINEIFLKNVENLDLIFKEIGKDDSVDYEYYNNISESKLFNIKSFPFDFIPNKEICDINKLKQLEKINIPNINLKNEINLEKLNIKDWDFNNEINLSKEIKIPDYFLKNYFEFEF